MRTFYVIVIALAGFLGAAGSSMNGKSGVTAVSDQQGMLVQGGGCGNVWTNTGFACNTGTVSCGPVQVDCTQQTVYWLVAGANGDQVQDQTANRPCNVCSAYGPPIACGTVYMNKVISTKGCNG
jgi:hypothetical protein